MTTPHRATAEQWADVESWAAEGLSSYSSILELRSRLEVLEKGATCPHIVTGDEGTSYCGLAEQHARIGQSDVPADTSAFHLSDDDPIPQLPAPVGSLVKAVHSCIVGEPACGHMQARAAIRAVAEWMRENEISFHAAYCLEREAKR